MQSREGAPPAPGKVAKTAAAAAWDLPTRVFPWLLGTLVLLAYMSRKWGDTGLVWHTWNGYAILILVIWRLLWGFTGSSMARFRSLFTWPWTAASDGLDLASSRPRDFLGHNWLGGPLALVMLGIIALQGVLGLIADNDHGANVAGPLVSKVAVATGAAATRWHILLFDVILVGIALQILASLLHRVWKGETLVKPTMTGNKPADHVENQPEATLAATGKALVCLIASTLLVLGGIMTAGGKVF